MVGRVPTVYALTYLQQRMSLTTLPRFCVLQRTPPRLERSFAILKMDLFVGGQNKTEWILRQGNGEEGFSRMLTSPKQSAFRLEALPQEELPEAPGGPQRGQRGAKPSQTSPQKNALTPPASPAKCPGGRPPVRPTQPRPKDPATARPTQFYQNGPNPPQRTRPERHATIEAYASSSAPD